MSLIRKVLVQSCMVLLFGHSAPAQTRTGLHLSPSAWLGGGNVKIAHVIQGYYELEPNMQRSYGGGVSIGYVFNDHVGLFIGLEYAQMRWKGLGKNYYGYNDEYYQEIEVNQKIVYTQIPLFLRLTSGKRREIGVCAELGFNYSFVKQAEFTEVGYDGGIFFYYAGDNNEFHNRSSVFTHTFLGVSIPLGLRVSAYTGPQFQYQLSEHFSDGNPYEGNAYILAWRAGASIRLN